MAQRVEFLKEIGGSIEMDVDGSVTPVVFFLTPQIVMDVAEVFTEVSLSVQLVDGVQVSAGLFGELPTLPVGNRIERVQSTPPFVGVVNLFGGETIKIAGDLIEAGQIKLIEAGNLTIEYALPTLELNALRGASLQWTVQDDLTEIDRMRVLVRFTRTEVSAI